MSVDARARAGLFLAMQYPPRSPVSRSRTSCAPPQQPSVARRRSCVPGSRKYAARWTGSRSTWRSRSATSMKAFPAVRRSGTRSRSSSCCSRASPFSTRPTRSRHRRAQGRRRRRQPSPRHRRCRHHAHHALHPDPALHPTRLRARVRRRSHRAGGRPELADQLEAEGYECFAKLSGATT